MSFKKIAGVGGAGLANFGIGMARMWQRASPADRKNFPQWMQDMSEWGKKKEPAALTTPTAPATPAAIAAPATRSLSPATPVETPAVTTAPIPASSATPTALEPLTPIKAAVDDSLKSSAASSNEYINTANSIGMGDMPTTMPMGGNDLALQLPGEATNLGIGALI